MTAQEEIAVVERIVAGVDEDLESEEAALRLGHLAR